MTPQSKHDILGKQHDINAFRSAIRDWLDDVVPDDWQSKMYSGSDEDYFNFQQWWMKTRHEVGLATPHWPKEAGGAGLGLKHQIILADEIARKNAPPLPMFIVSFNHIPATLLPWGTEEQKRKYLPGIAEGDVWCQGFSEPGAGSDLASLRTKAVRSGDHYVVNGQKIWSSNSMYAKYCILLTRTDTDVPKHQGITYFLLDMKSPGVEVRPIRQANGRAEFAEMFLTDVRIPVENRVGEEGQGWAVAQSTLSSERGILAFEGAERQRYMFEGFLSDAVKSDAAWLKDDQLRREFMNFFAEMQAGRRLLRQLLRENEEDHTRFTITPALVKLTGTTLRQQFTSWLVKMSGLDGQRLHEGVEEDMGYWMFDYITSFGGTIAAGTNEIMRNIISERGLGMPRIK